MVFLFLISLISVHAYTNDYGTCTCNSCIDCTNALNDNACDVVLLNTDIGYKGIGDCIGSPSNFNNKIFDCQDHTIRGIGILQPPWQNSGISLSSKSNNIIRNCIITGFSYGIHLGGSSNNIIEDSTISNNLGSGISLNGNSNNNIIKNCIVEDNGDHGIALYHSSNNNTITGCSVNSNNQNGIAIHTSSNNLIENCTVANNKLGVGWSGNGIAFWQSSNNIIKDCSSYSNNGVGIALGGNNNTVLGNSIFSNNAGGINLEGNNSIVLGNSIFSNNGDGIRLWISDYNTITNNTALNNEVGISLGNSSNNIITNNTVSLNNRSGIGLDSSNNNIIEDCTVKNNLGVGIGLGSSSNNLIKNCVVEGNGDGGIALWHNCTNNIITGVSVNDNTQTGISIHTSSNNLIENCMVSNTKLGYGWDGVGIAFWYASNNSIKNCSSHSNDESGISLLYSGSNYLSNNTMSLNTYNFYIRGEVISDFVQTINTTNTVDGKPIYYLVGVSDLVIDSNAGFVGVVSSSNITVRDLTLTNNSQGVLFVNTLNSFIENVTALNNEGGILLYYSNYNNLINNQANNNERSGIQSEYSDYNNITNNTVSNNEDGIVLEDSDSNNLINNQADNNQEVGIELEYSNYNTITHNTASNNEDGIALGDSGYNTLTDNTMSLNTYNFYIWGESISHFIQTINTTNTVDGKPIYYLVGVSDLVIDSNAGFVGVVSSSNIIVRDLTLTNNSQGVLFVNTSNSFIENNTALNNVYGLLLYYSEFNNLINNRADNNQEVGILLGDSDYNTLTNNVPSNNRDGIALMQSDSNNLINNQADNNQEVGIYLEDSDYNTMADNTASSNQEGIFLEYSDYNNLINNQADNNQEVGIYLEDSDYNNITNSTASNNYGGIDLEYSNNNIIINNSANSNQYGVYLESSSNNQIYHNNMYGNSGYQVYSNGAVELSYNNKGNYWGHSCPEAFLAPSEITPSDSNSNDVIDSYPYGILNGWSIDVPCLDNCPNTYNPDQEESDGDGLGNSCDNCPYVYNPGQEDIDGDDIGDVCDVCPNDAGNDADDDGYCPGSIYNPPKIGGNDCNDADASVYPDAPELCSDGVDQDCSGTDIACLRMFAPILYFHPDEIYPPRVINSMLHQSNLMKIKICIKMIGLHPVPYICYKNKDMVPVAVSSLNDKSPAYFLDLIGTKPGGPFDSVIPNPSRFNGYKVNVYGREVIYSNHIILQYWFFYPFNIDEMKVGTKPTISTHEGDWEMIQVRLERNTRQPKVATYSFHQGGMSYPWEFIEKQGTHPRVYVARDGHGNWRTSGTHIWYAGGIRIYDRTSSNGPVMHPDFYPITQISGSTSWVDFEGRWGETHLDKTEWNWGPRSPAHIRYAADQPNRWDAPRQWERDPMPSGYHVVGLSPVNLHVYDAQGNHVGPNESGEIEIEINGTYAYIPSDDGPEAVIIYTEEDLFFEIEGTDQGKFDFILTRYERNSSLETSVTYENVTIDNGTIATLNITPENPGFVMDIDQDGDGTVDLTKLPDNLTVEFIPPGNVSLENNTPEPPPVILDGDQDGIYNSLDNCPNDYNPDQIDTDEDGIGNTCDDDDDNDEVNDASDNCPLIYNQYQGDDDIDQIGDLCDNCPDDYNPQQNDNDIDGIGDVCDGQICGNNVTEAPEECDDGNLVGGDNCSSSCTLCDPGSEICDRLDNDCDGEIDEGFDADFDDVADCFDNCPDTENIWQEEIDGDGIGDACDNCPYNYNPGQEDSDDDGIGDVCAPVTISGYVSDVDDNPLQVMVDLEDIDETIEMMAMTDENGYFEFINLTKGYYDLEVNDDSPILWDYTGAAVGDEDNWINATSDVEVNITLWRVRSTLETNATEYENGDVIEVSIAVENNEIYDLENWKVGAVLYFENDTVDEFIDAEEYFVNVSSGTESFFVYLEIPLDNPYDYLYLEGGIWTEEAEFQSSKGLLPGEIWSGKEKQIFLGETISINISLSKGWNLMSIPLALPDPILPAPFESIEGNYSHAFTYLDGKWYSYYAGEPATEKTIDPTIGLWINMTENDILEVEGYELIDPDIELISGWNLVGYPHIEENNISNMVDESIKMVYMYNGSWSSYIRNKTFNSLEVLKPGFGYWVKK